MTTARPVSPTMSWPTSRVSSPAATGTCPHAAYLFVQFHDAGQAQRWLRQLVPAITSARAVADRAERREAEAVGRAEHRLHRRRPRRARAAAARSLHVSRRVPGGHRAAETVANPRRHGGERSRASGNSAEPATPPIHAVLVVHAVVGGGARGRVPRAARAARRHGRRRRRAARQHAERIPARRRSRAVRISRRHRAAVDCRDHRRRRAHRRVHPRIPEPLPDHPADAGRARGAGPSTRVLPPLANPYHASRAAARSRHQRLLRRVPQAPAGCRGLLAVHETRSRPQHGRGGRRPHDLAGVAMRRAMAERRAAGAGAGRRRSADPATATTSCTATTRMAWPARSARTSAAPTRATSSSRTRPLSRSACPRRIVCSAGRGSFGPALFDPAVLTRSRRTGRRATPLLELADDGRRARHPFLLRQREHQEPVRVRAADLVQQPSLRRPQRQQGSDLGDNNRTGEPSSHMTIPAAVPCTNCCAAALRDGEGRRVPVHAEPDGPQIPRGLGSFGPRSAVAPFSSALQTIWTCR